MLCKPPKMNQLAHGPANLTGVPDWGTHATCRFTAASRPRALLPWKRKSQGTTTTMTHLSSLGIRGLNKLWIKPLLYITSLCLQWGSLNLHASIPLQTLYQDSKMPFVENKNKTNKQNPSRLRIMDTMYEMWPSKVYMLQSPSLQIPRLDARGLAAHCWRR